MFEIDEKDSLLDTVYVGVFDEGKLVATARIMNFYQEVAYFGRACVKMLQRERCREIFVFKYGKNCNRFKKKQKMKKIADFPHNTMHLHFMKC